MSRRKRTGLGNDLGNAVLDLIENVPWPEKCTGKKILDSGITDSKGCGAPAKFALTTKPMLTELLFGDIFK
ncbi:MAG TPA: hypothetical protein ENG51_22095 [Deltaproteobacteria bacterium]|nr:hypothetical protein [Deltaproteobacteria bacterium]